MTTSTSRPAPFSGGNSLTVTSGPEQPPLSATSGSYDNRRRVAPDICSCRFLSRPPAYRFRRTAASRQQRPFHNRSRCHSPTSSLRLGCRTLLEADATFRGLPPQPGGSGPVHAIPKDGDGLRVVDKAWSLWPG